jgi:hypothetical protein
MPESLREIRLPTDLCALAEKKYGGQFATLEELIIYILRSLVSEEAKEMDEAEARMIEERLRELGYLEPTA